VEKREGWYLIVICALLAAGQWVHGQHLRLHDEMLRTITHPDLDTELAAMSPPREA
jgi:hypothetical protein